MLPPSRRIGWGCEEFLLLSAAPREPCPAAHRAVRIHHLLAEGGLWSVEATGLSPWDRQEDIRRNVYGTPCSVGCRVGHGELWPSPFGAPTVLNVGALRPCSSKRRVVGFLVYLLVCPFSQNNLRVFKSSLTWNKECALVAQGQNGPGWTELRRVNAGGGGQDPCPEDCPIQPPICLTEGGCEHLARSSSGPDQRTTGVAPRARD